MDNNMICNTETEVSKTLELNDRDYLNCVLEIEKSMASELNTFLNEASNDRLFNDVYDMFDEIKTNARDTFLLLFRNGWYKLEKACCTKKDETVNTLNEKLKELEQ